MIPSTCHYKVSVLLIAAGCFCGAAAQTEKPAQTEIGVQQGETRQYSDIQLATAREWLAELAPLAPEKGRIAAAEHFLEELSARRPDLLGAVGGGTQSKGAFSSALLRHLCSALPGEANAALREQLARARVEAVLAASGQDVAEAASLITKLQDSSKIIHRRLLEGRLEDDELLLQLQRTRGDHETPRTLPAREIGALDIVSEFVRQNQQGNAAERLHAYMVKATLQPVIGDKQSLILFRMRQDRFRLVVQEGGFTRMILAYNGKTYHQQTADRGLRELSRTQVGDAIYFSEFINPIILGSGYTFTKLDDLEHEGRPCHLLKVQRPDGSHYVSVIEKESYREVARKYPDGAVSRYSDFREVAGVTFAHREEPTDAQGRAGVLTIEQIVPNPGLVQALFDPPEVFSPIYFGIERQLAATPQNSAPSQP